MVCAFFNLCLVYWYFSIRYFVKIGFWWLALRWPSESLRLEEGWWAVDINIGQNTSIKQYNLSTLYRHQLHTNMQRSNMTKYRSNNWSDSDLRMRDSLLLLCLSNDAMFQRVQRFILIMSFIKTKCCLLDLKGVTLNDDNSKVFYLVFFLADKKGLGKGRCIICDLALL